MNRRLYLYQTIGLLLVALAMGGPALADKDRDRGRGNRQSEHARDREQHGRDRGARDRGRSDDHGAQDRRHGDKRHENRDRDRDEDRQRYEPRRRALPESWRHRRRLNMPCHVIRNHTYVPIREPFEALGGQVIWYADRREAYIIYSDRTVIVAPDSSQAIVIANGQRRPEYWENPPLLLGGSLYVPVRPVANGLNVSVGYASGNVALGADLYIPLG